MGINQGKVSQLIEKFDKDNISSCILAISKFSFLSHLNISHSALFLIDTNSDASDKNRGNGILIEYGDYSPKMSKDEQNYVKNGLVIYRYGIKGG